MIDLDKDFEMKMGHLSRRTHELEIPVMIIIEGALASVYELRALPHR